ncbi:MAG: surface-adhesin E family protein [Comamonadaceae bacterium]
MASLSIAHAEWKKIGANDQGTFYVDEATLTSKVKIRSFLLLDDMKKPTLQSDRSIISHNEVDCGSLKFRSVKTTYFSQPMGKGKSTVLEPDAKPDSPATPKDAYWLDLTVGQPSEQIVKWACKVK